MRFFYRGIPYSSNSDSSDSSNSSNLDRRQDLGLSDVKIPNGFIALRYRGVAYLRARYGSRPE